MKTHSILTAALLLAAVATAHAQTAQPKNPVKGYILTLAGDTIHGTVDYLSGEENARGCRFCAEGQTDYRLYGPDELQGYRFMNDGIYYVARTLPINGEQRRIFAEYLLKGGISLYRYESDSQTLYFMTNEDGKTAVIREEDYSNYREDDAMARKRGNLREAASMMAISTKATNSLWKRDITANNLVDITRRYNEEYCTEAGDCVVFQYDALHSVNTVTRIRMQLGTGRCRVNNNEFIYKTNMHRIGVGAEFTSLRKNPNLSIEATLLAGIYNDRHFLSDSYTGQKRLWLQMDAGALYRFNAYSPSTPFVRGGFTLSLPMGVYAGAGWEFNVGKHRLQLSATGNFQGIVVEGHILSGMLDVAFII